ncbi:Endothelial differentiation-related factor 1 [Aphelenchoides besseyi]|nr:Endothelial differentiation-related factor 1 [Aphelenchoides besseyi]
MKPVLISFAVFLFICSKCEAVRSKRQFSPFSRYICGVAPFRFSSDIPCNYYAICPNGGFMMNIGCRNNDTCHLYRVDSICMGDCCCTVPKIENGTTTIRPPGLQRDDPIYRS